MRTDTQKRLIAAPLFLVLFALADFPTRLPPPGQARVRIHIENQSGDSTGIRLRVVNSAGDYFAPLGHLPSPDTTKRMAGDVILGDGDTSPLELHAYVYDNTEIDLPPGRYTFQARKGLEYEPISKQAEITPASDQIVTLALKKFDDYEAKGWYPGDTHMHFPDPSGIRYEMEAEGLRVCSLLLLKNGNRTGRPGDGNFQNVEHFTGKLSPVSSGSYFVKTGEEFRHGLLAHLIFQNLKSVVWPVSVGGLRESGVGGFDWPMMMHATRDAHDQGALVTWAHWPYPSLEAPLDIALGQIDSLDILTTGSPFEHHPVLVDVYKMHGPRVYSMPPIDVYYSYLNCGFKLAASSGSDKMATNPPLGSARTYVKTEGPLSYDLWVEGIRKGRTFISTYPLLTFSVNGKEAGETLTLPPGTAQLSIKLSAKSIEPYDVLEVICNGKVIASAKPSGKWNEASIEKRVAVETGGWIAARAHGRKMLPYGLTWWRQPVFAHTSPIYLEMAGKPAPAAESAALFLDQLSYLANWIEREANMPSEENRREAMKAIDEAKRKYEMIGNRK